MGINQSSLDSKGNQNRSGGGWNKLCNLGERKINLDTEDLKSTYKGYFDLKDYY